MLTTSDESLVNTEADRLGELIGKTEPEFTQPSKTDFEPWHKPRKHWIRQNQWASECSALIDNSLLPQEEFRYLSLPGPDLLDVRQIAALCLKKGKKLRFLGFNNDNTNPDQNRCHLGAANICLADHVNRRSKIIIDNFETIANPATLGRSYLHAEEAFDAINLDLCNSVLEEAPSNDQDTYYSAIHALLDHQIKNRTRPFLLFLTTRTNKDRINDVALRKLALPVASNLSNSIFESAFVGYVGAKKFEITNLRDNARWQSQWSDDVHARFVEVGICKWLLGLLWKAAPSWTVQVRSAYKYKVYRKGDMLSLAFLCAPSISSATDKSGLSNLRPASTNVAVSEVAIACQMLQELKSSIDIDDLLERTPNVEFNKLVISAANELKEAGYSDEKYSEQFFRR